MFDLDPLWRGSIYIAARAKFASAPRSATELKGKGKRNIPLLSVDSHRLSAASDVLSRVDTHDGVTLVVDRDQTRVPGIAGGTVVDRSVGRVVPLPKVEMVKERVSLL